MAKKKSKSKRLTKEQIRRKLPKNLLPENLDPEDEIFLLEFAWYRENQPRKGLTLEDINLFWNTMKVAKIVLKDLENKGAIRKTKIGDTNKYKYFITDKGYLASKLIK